MSRPTGRSARPSRWPLSAASAMLGAWLLSITSAHVPSASAQFDPVLSALGYVRRHDTPDLAYWRQDGLPEVLLYPARDNADGPHEHGRVGWQHLAFAVDSRAEVDRVHDIAVDAGWTAVRAPKEYPRFSDRYYASFIEDDNGIRLEIVHNPPRHAD